MVGLSGLQFHLVKMNGTGIDTDGSTGLHACRAYSQFFDGTGEMCGCRFGTTSTGDLLSSDVHQSVEKGAGCNHHGTCRKCGIPDGSHTTYFSLFNEDFRNLILPDVKIVRVFEVLSPFRDETCAVALGTRTPHGRTFRTVQHLELNGCGIRNDAGKTAQGIDFAHDLSFRNTTDGRVAAHLCDFVHVHRDEACFGSEPGGGMCGFASGVACTDNNHIV